MAEVGGNSEQKSDDIPIVSAEEFAACDIEKPLDGLNEIASFALSQRYLAAAHASDVEQRHGDARVYGLLNAICTIHLRPGVRGDAWGPMFVTAKGRTAIPSDFTVEQSAVLSTILDRIKNPALRARIADIVWTKDRRNARAAKIAIEAYCDCANGLMDHTYIAQFQPEEIASHEVLQAVQRAIQISFATRKRNAPVPDPAKASFARLHVAAKDSNAAAVYLRTIHLGLSEELLVSADIVAELEEVARRGTGEHPWVYEPIWATAAHIYENLGDEVGRRRCLLARVDQILKMRDQCGGAGAKAHWVMDALQVLLHVRDVDKIEEELLLELRKLQRASIKEMGRIPIDLGPLAGDRDEVLRLFSGMTLSECLKQFALLSRSIPDKDLRAEAIKLRETSPLMAMMGAVHVDEEGKTITKTPGSSSGDDAQEDWYLRMFNQIENLHRLQVVSSRIEPARQIMSIRFSITEQDFERIVGLSPFVPPSQRQILALGFARFVQGDMMSAAYLIVPQLEPCMRHILKINGCDPAKQFSDGTEEDRSLGSLYHKFRPDLDRILSPDLAAEIARLFDLSPGPALRHEAAHGHLSPEDCFGPSVIYGMWLMYRICCLFVLEDWDIAITPIE